MTQEVQKNSWRAWLLATRPKTLIAALVPVVVATALAHREGRADWTAAWLCMAFAGLMQIASNLINDWHDYLQGADGEDRLGPPRACAQGWISVKAMQRGVGVVVVLAAAVGLCLLHWGGWQLLLIGGACLAAAFLYTMGGSYLGLGDVMVLVFFGFVPVVTTYYIQTQEIPFGIWWVGAGCGCMIDTLLIVNNYRDRDTDKRAGKRTLVVRFGEPLGRRLYLLAGVAAWLCLLPLAMSERATLWVLCATFPVLCLHWHTYRRLSQIRAGRGLNEVLGWSARNIFLYGGAVVIGLLVA